MPDVMVKHMLISQTVSQILRYTSIHMYTKFTTDRDTQVFTCTCSSQQTEIHQYSHVHAVHNRQRYTSLHMYM